MIYLPKQERRQWADWNKSVRVGTCLEVSHMQPQLSAILSEWQHVKWACVWALSGRAAPSWQRASAHVCKISSCNSAMWIPTAKSPTLQSGPSSLGLFSIPSYEKISSGNDFQTMKKSRGRSRPGLKSSQKIFFFQGDKVVATKVGEVYWVIGGTTLKNKKIFFCDKLFLSYLGR